MVVLSGATQEGLFGDASSNSEEGLFTYQHQGRPAKRRATWCRVILIDRTALAENHLLTSSGGIQAAQRGFLRVHCSGLHVTILTFLIKFRNFVSKRFALIKVERLLQICKFFGHYFISWILWTVFAKIFYHNYISAWITKFVAGFSGMSHIRGTLFIRSHRQNPRWYNEANSRRLVSRHIARASQFTTEAQQDMLLPCDDQSRQQNFSWQKNERTLHYKSVPVKFRRKYFLCNALNAECNWSNMKPPG